MEFERVARGPVSRRCFAAFSAIVALTAPALATWSIIAVNTRTKEVCVASATCLSNFNLRQNLAVMRIGVGGGAAQASVDFSGVNRQIIWNGLGGALSPAQILGQLSAQPGHASKQYGIVNMNDDPITFTGASTLAANLGVVGVQGDFKYAIQGNILAGNEVVPFAEQAFLTTNGDLGQKVMAAMEAARFWGGDGRCSCSVSAPTSCQPLPPPTPFASAFTGFFLIGRIGDTGAAQCNSSSGCAGGSLYCALNVITANSDPVPLLQQQYDAWRAALAGRPDQVRSEVLVDAQSLVADRRTSAEVTVVLRDLDGQPLTAGGATLSLVNFAAAPAVTTPSAITDHGDGTYSFRVRASAGAGTDRWRITVNDGVGPVTLQPDVVLRVDPIQPVHCGFDAVSITDAVSVPIVIHGTPPRRGRPYLMLASNAGTSPGLPFAGTHLPLNASNLLTFTYLNTNTSELSNTFGLLDRVGRAEARFTPHPNMLTQLVGSRIEWSAVVFEPLGSIALAPAGFDVLP